MRDTNIIMEFDRVNDRMKKLSSEVSKVLVDHNVMISALKNVLIEKKILTQDEFQDMMTKIVVDIKTKVEEATKKAVEAAKSESVPAETV